MEKAKGWVFVAGVLILEALVLFYSINFGENENQMYLYASRYSARLSVVMMIVILAYTGRFGLKNIFRTRIRRGFLTNIVMALVINHLIHFYFLATYREVSGIGLTIIDNKAGFVSYVLLVLSPLGMRWVKSLNWWLYGGLLTMLGFMSFVIIRTYLARVQALPEPYVFVIGLALMTITLVMNIYRLVREAPVPLSDRD
ncbi:hypothetical protein FUAX_36170 [Fulvitalea axinellae]|uniref:Ferric oxidoreductase domain-containing protein n=1 Tax=Fulvitalea axinellae TaxID=1182444 RepID=A0AAU9DJ44_9BACT|nr:hypothetical protein FUAX_36170 [Fulvitalea axinellae]